MLKNAKKMKSVGIKNHYRFLRHNIQIYGLKCDFMPKIPRIEFF